MNSKTLFIALVGLLVVVGVSARVERSAAHRHSKVVVDFEGASEIADSWRTRALKEETAEAEAEEAPAAEEEAEAEDPEAAGEEVAEAEDPEAAGEEEAEAEDPEAAGEEEAEGEGEAAGEVPAFIGEVGTLPEGETIKMGGEAGWEIIADYTTVEAKVGDILSFQYAPGTHDIWVMPALECDFTDAVEIFEDAADFQLLEAGTYYFSCKKPAHCESGQLVQVNVAAAEALAPTVVMPIPIAPAVDVKAPVLAVAPSVAPARAPAAAPSSAAKAFLSAAGVVVGVMLM